MNRKNLIFVALLMLALPLFAPAQDADQAEGRQYGGYTVHQSIEFGGRITDVVGNESMYNTFTNLHSGPRLLSQELTMEAPPTVGTLFDRLYVNSFGFGGDPENLARVRISKAKWYNFVGLYRRDKNYFDYNLFANPLTANLGAGVTNSGAGPTVNLQVASPFFNNSGHTQFVTRNMGDFALTLFPESAVSVRLGYARNDNAGQFNSTAGQTGQLLLINDTDWRSDRYQGGVDLKFLPRTTISADFFFEHDKTDLNFLDNPWALYGAAGSLPFDPGLFFFPAATTTCIVSVGPPIVFANSSSCTSGALGYAKLGNVRTDIPTGQLSLVSNYFRNLDITASGVYSSASSDFDNFNEFFYSSAPTNLTGPARNTRISTSADLGLTYHLSRSLSISDKFRWYNWRQPGAQDLSTFSCALVSGGSLTSDFLNPCGVASNLFAFLQLINPGVGLSGDATSGRFLRVTPTRTFIGERSYFNTAKLHWDPSRHFRSYVGYRYGRRELKAGTGGINRVFTQNIDASNTCVLTAIDPATCLVPGTASITPPDVEKINVHTALFGTVIRPVDAWRINADVELLYSDAAFTNISPRHQQRIRAYTTFKLKRWVSINGGVHFVETRNDFAPSSIVEDEASPNFELPLFPATGTLLPFYGHKDHWRSYSAGATFNPNSKVLFDVGWTLLDQKIESGTCVPVAATAFPAGSGVTLPANLCLNGPTGNTRAIPMLLNYVEETNTFFGFLTYRPVKRVGLTFGYEVTGDNGRTNWLRADNGQPLLVVGDVYGNVPFITANLVGGSNAVGIGCPPNATPVAVTGGTGCAFPGPFPDQPLGPQALTWHKASAGLSVDVTKNVTFKGLWSYYNYNSKDTDPALAQLFVVTPRDFHANVGTLSLKYSF
ncbi:MAG: hypothetical protein ACE14M_05850 [Terriglobales bacterium]